MGSIDPLSNKLLMYVYVFLQQFYCLHFVSGTVTYNVHNTPLLLFLSIVLCVRRVMDADTKGSTITSYHTIGY